MAIYYIRPLAGGPYGAANGLTYDDAFAGFDNKSGISDGDTVWICGTHVKDFLFVVGDSGSSAENIITWRGDYADDPGILAPTEGSVSVYFNGVSHIKLLNIEIANARTTAGIFYAGVTDGVIIDGITLTFTENVRGIYMATNTHTNWQILNTTVNNNAVTAGNTQAVYIWGNNATAGTTGLISNLTVNGGADYLYTSSNHVGLHIDDWNGLLIENYVCNNMFAGIRLTNADNNIIARPTIINCGLGLKSAGNGGGFGVNIELSSASNIVKAGYFTNNYQHYVDSTASGGNNEIIGCLLVNPIVNSISYTSTSTSTGLIHSNTIIHNPVDNEGHGIVVQNGDASTKASIKNNLVVCGVTGLNIQCVAVGGISGTNYDLITFDNNCYHVTNSALIGKLGVTEYSTLAAWITDITADANIDGNEANSIASDPLLDSDYKLTALSPCIGVGEKGIATGYATYDQPIPSFGVDIGIQSQHGPFHPTNL